MKNTSIFLLLMICGFFGGAQEKNLNYFDVDTTKYSNWAIDVSGGLTKTRDRTSVGGYDFGVGLRYNFNKSFAAKFKLSQTSAAEDYTSATLMFGANIVHLLDFDDYQDLKKMSIYLYLGGEFASLDGHVDSSIIFHRKSNFHMMGRGEVMWRVSKKLSLGLYGQNTFGVNSRPNNRSTTITTSNLTGGIQLGLSLGKGSHLDWKPKADYFSYLQEIRNLITDLQSKENESTVVNNDTIIIKRERVEIFFFFDHDKPGKNEFPELSELNKYSMAQLVYIMKKNDNLKVKFICSASPPGTSIYNEVLSRRRGELLKKYAVMLGVDPARIDIDAKGEIKLGSQRSDPFARKVHVLFE